MKEIKEGKASIVVEKGVFYNPYMRLSRSISSLLISTIREKVNVIDGFSASGIRGIRYRLENKNVGKVLFIDISKKAVELTKKNLEKNSLEGKVEKGNFIELIESLKKKEYNFIELDPFGSAVEFLWPSVRYLSKFKESYLSTTFTDTAVLCGVQEKACFRKYHSLPLHNYSCHEIGIRIILRKLLEVSSEFGIAIEPLLSFYYRHQMKVIVKLKHDKEKAYSQLSRLKYIFYKNNCFRLSRFRRNSHYKGPIWGEDIHKKENVEQAVKLIEKKEYYSKTEKKELKKMYNAFSQEIGERPFFYSIHEIAKELKLNPVGIKELIGYGKKLGVKIKRTHFSWQGFKSKASCKKIKMLIKRLAREKSKG